MWGASYSNDYYSLIPSRGCNSYEKTSFEMFEHFIQASALCNREGFSSDNNYVSLYAVRHVIIEPNNIVMSSL